MPGMTHIERVLTAVKHLPVDRFPTDIWMTPEVLSRLFSYFHVDNYIELLDQMDIDGIIDIAPTYVGPETRRDGDYREDEWGMGYRKQPYGTGVYEEQVYFPLAQAQTISDLEKYPWPTPDWYDYSTLPIRADQLGGRAVSCGYTAIFFWHNRLRGLELSLMDPILRPDFTHFLLGRLSDFFQEYHQRCFEALKGKAQLTQVTDDFGSQNGLLISPKIFDTFYRAPIQKAIDLAKSFGIYVFHHDDGDIRSLLPRLVEMGITILNPVQWRCGDWDLDELKTRYGQALCFHGGVDNQQTLPFGTPQDVRAEVIRLKRTLGKDRTGIIIAPCHNIQPVTPIENILALYEAVREENT